MLSIPYFTCGYASACAAYGRGVYGVSMLPNVWASCMRCFTRQNFSDVSHCNYSSILNHFRDFWRWGISWPWNIGYRSLTLRSYARSVHRWNLQTRGYYFRRQYEFIFIRFIRSKLQKKLIVQCHSRSSQIEIGANRKSMCDFLLAFHCDWLSSNET